MPAGPIYQASPCGYDGVQLALNAWHFGPIATIGAGATIQEMADYFDALWAGEYKSLFANTSNYLGTLFQQVNPLPVSVIGKGIANAGAGAAGAIGAPTGVAGLIQKNTAQGGRRGRGRAYVGFVAAGDIQGDGKPTAGYLANLDALIGDVFGTHVIVGAGGTTTLVAGVWSKKFDTFNAYTLLAHGINFASQRRRSAFGRPNANPF